MLIIAGTRDQHMTPQETQALFAPASEPKELWLVPDAAHVDLHDFAKDEYERRISAHFAKYLH